MAKQQRVSPDLVGRRYMGVAEAARYLGITEVALYHLVTRRTIPCTRLGRRIGVDRHALDEVLNSPAAKRNKGQRGVSTSGSEGVSQT